MAAFKAFIVEDHPLHAEKLELMLEALGLEVAGMADNALDALTLLQEQEVDLLLLDIELTGSFSGIDLAERVRQKSRVPIIYCTSVRDDAERGRAVATNPEAYLYKPIREDALATAIELAMHRSMEQAATREATASNDGPLNTALFVRVGNSLKKLLFDDIVYVHVSAKNYCDIRTTERTLSSKTSLNELGKVLPAQQFMRVSRSYLINLAFVQEINEREQHIETGYEPVTIGAAYKQELYQRLNTL